jgi:hypothetical protein
LLASGRRLANEINLKQWLSFKMLFRRGNRKKSTHPTPLIWHLQAPDQASTVDFFLFPRLKSIMKDACFVDVAAIQERVTAVLQSIPKEAFADNFQKLPADRNVVRKSREKAKIQVYEQRYNKRGT